MSHSKKPSAIEKRAEHPTALVPFALVNLKHKLPLVFPLRPDLPPSPKPRYRSHYRYLGWEDLSDNAVLETLSAFEIAVRLFDYSSLERLLAAHMYRPSAKGQVPFHPVSLYLLSLFRRERKLSRHEALRVLRHEEEGRFLRRYLGFDQAYPSESGLRYFESQIRPELQQEINALQIEVLYQAALLPSKPGTDDPLFRWHAARSALAHALQQCADRLLRACAAPLPGSGEEQAGM